MSEKAFVGTILIVNENSNPEKPIKINIGPFPTVRKVKKELEERAAGILFDMGCVSLFPYEWAWAVNKYIRGGSTFRNLYAGPGKSYAVILYYEKLETVIDAILYHENHTT